MSKLKELIEQLCPDGVEYKTFGECGEFYGGLTGKTKKDFGEGSPFLTYMGIFAHTAARFDCVDYVRLKDGEKQNAVHRGDVLITVSSETPDECGMTCVVTKEPEETTYLNSFCTGWRPYDVDFADPDYLKYALRSHGVRQQIVRTANGVTRFNVSKPLLAKVSFPVPPIEVQHEIVRILDSMQELDDALSEELWLRKKQVRSYRERQFDRCFGDPFENNFGWPVKTLEQVLEPGRHVSYGIVKTGDDIEGGVPVFRPVDIADGKRPDLGSLKRTSSEISEQYKRTKLDGDEILITVRALIGELYLVTEEFAGCNVGRGIVPIKADDRIINRRFLYHLMKTNAVQDWFESHTKGVAQTGLNMGELKNIPIIVPPLEKQHAFLELLPDVNEYEDDEYIILLEQEIQARRKQFEHYRDKLLDFPEKVA